MSEAPYIEFEDVRKSFGPKVVLDGVSFRVMPGRTLAILGRSGVGKSVSLQHLMGFLRPDSGRVIVAGEDIAGYDERQMAAIRRKVTMVFQSGALFDSLSVGENVAFPLRERGGRSEEEIVSRVERLLESVGLPGAYEQMPSELSTGMRRSVAIARALAAEPESILYDEPTTMVDPMMAHLLGDLIVRLRKKWSLTSIVVTHDMALARKVADEILFLHEGRVAFSGTPSEMERCGEPIVQEFLALDELELEAWGAR